MSEADVAFLISEIELEFSRNKFGSFPPDSEKLKRFKRIKAALTTPPASTDGAVGSVKM